MPIDDLMRVFATWGWPGVVALMVLRELALSRKDKAEPKVDPVHEKLDEILAHQNAMSIRVAVIETEIRHLLGGRK